jgi:1-acyl-sn-glycerol-3-phosphate acyltransferase
MKSILSFHRPPVHISFGKTFILPEIIRGNHEEMLDRNTDEIMCRIAALLPEQYRGFYRDHPRLQEILTNPS